MAMLRIACHSITCYGQDVTTKGERTVLEEFFSPKTGTWKNNETQTEYIHVEVCGRAIKRKQAKL